MADSIPSFFSGIEDLLFLQEYEREYNLWLQNPAEPAASSARADYAKNAEVNMSDPASGQALLDEATTHATGLTG